MTLPATLDRNFKPSSTALESGSEAFEGAEVALQIETGVVEPAPGETATVKLFDTPDALAVTMAVWLDAVLAVDTENVVLDVPAAMVAVAGTDTMLLLDVRETLICAVVTAVSTTVQLELLPAATDGESQVNEEITGAVAAGAESDSGNVTCAPAAAAVITPDSVLVTADTEALNDPLVFPAPTVMLDGTVKCGLLLLSATVTFEDGTPPPRVTEHDTVPGDTTVDGLQFKPDSVVGAAVTAIAPPVPDPGIADPSAATTDMALSCNGKDEGCVPPATVAVTFATTPDAMVVLFTPATMHVTVPEPVLQAIDLLAAFAADASVMVTSVIDAGYVSVHSTPAGADADVVRDRVSGTVAPAATVAELNASDAC